VLLCAQLPRTARKRQGVLTVATGGGSAPRLRRNKLDAAAFERDSVAHEPVLCRDEQHAGRGCEGEVLHRVGQVHAAKLVLEAAAAVERCTRRRQGRVLCFVEACAWERLVTYRTVTSTAWCWCVLCCDAHALVCARMCQLAARRRTGPASALNASTAQCQDSRGAPATTLLSIPDRDWPPPPPTNRMSPRGQADANNGCPYLKVRCSRFEDMVS
jgi:hypothetical protein